MHQEDLFSVAAEPDSSLLDELFRTADEILVKKLSNNDRDWAQLPNKHQAGVYIPPNQRDSGFFPPLVEKERRQPAGDPIREVFFPTNWPQVGERRDRTRLVHYTSKGSETHLTGIPKAAFATLGPASFLVMGRKAGDDHGYTCLTIGSGSDDSALLEDVLELGPDFIIDIFEPRSALAAERARVVAFAEEVAAAWLNGGIVQFAAGNAIMPSTADLARLARRDFLEARALADLNPFSLEAPGDALREISRGIEWDLFRDFQRRERAVEVLRAVLGDFPVRLQPRDMVRRLVNGITDIDRIMLSASQQRKSRAGYSFEHHIEAMLEAGSVPFSKQVVIEAKKRPDFVLPSARRLGAPAASPAAAIILSAKTTLRERWKQVQREMVAGDLFLATVDDSIAANAIEDMASLGIVLVVPESLKASQSTEYVRHDNVIDFRAFFQDELRAKRMPAWQAA